MVDDSLEALGERIAEQAAHLDAAHYRLLTDLHDFDNRGGWTHQGARSCAHWLSWRLGWDVVTARDHVRVAHKLADLPEAADALRRGELSYSKVRAITRVATAATEHLLVEYARLTTGAQLERICRQFRTVMRHDEDGPGEDPERRHVRRRDQADGMVRIEAVLHPDEAELVWAMLTDAAKRGCAAAASGARDSAESPCPADAAPRADIAATGMRSTPTPQTDSAESPHTTASTIEPDSAEAPGTTPSTIEPGSTEAPRWANALPRTDAAATDAHTPAPQPDSAKPLRSTPSIIERLRALDPSEFPSLDQPSQPGDSELAWFAVRSLLDGPAATPPELKPSSLDTATARVDAAIPRTATLASFPAPAFPARDAGPAPASAESIHAPSPSPSPAPARRTSIFGPTGFDRADALVALAQAYLRGDRPERAPVDVIVTIPLATLQDRTAGPIDAGWLGETAIAGNLARRLSCDAGLIEVIEDEHGKPLAVSRKQRTISGSLKRALRRRDGGCAFPGCTNQIYLEGHHILHWIQGGETSLDNSALLCTQHHRHVHEYGVTIELDATGHPQFFDARGRRIERVPAPPAVRGPTVADVNAPLAITAETIACGWTGCQVPYRNIIGALVRASGVA